MLLLLERLEGDRRVALRLVELRKSAGELLLLMNPDRGWIEGIRRNVVARSRILILGRLWVHPDS